MHSTRPIDQYKDSLITVRMIYFAQLLQKAKGKHILSTFRKETPGYAGKRYLKDHHSRPHTCTHKHNMWYLLLGSIEITVVAFIKRLSRMKRFVFTFKIHLNKQFLMCPAVDKIYCEQDILVVICISIILWRIFYILNFVNLYMVL